MISIIEDVALAAMGDLSSRLLAQCVPGRMRNVQVASGELLAWLQYRHSSGRDVDLAIHNERRLSIIKEAINSDHGLNSVFVVTDNAVQFRDEISIQLRREFAMAASDSRFAIEAEE